MGEHAELLTRPSNYAVVQLPTRKFPGIVFQGDSAHSIFTRLTLLKQSGCIQDEDMQIELDELIELFTAVLASYEQVLARHGIELPYVKRR